MNIDKNKNYKRNDDKYHDIDDYSSNKNAFHLGVITGTKVNNRVTRSLN